MAGSEEKRKRKNLRWEDSDDLSDDGEDFKGPDIKTEVRATTRKRTRKIE